MRSIGARLTWGYALVVLLTVIAALAGGYVLLRRELIQGIDLLNFAEFREIHERAKSSLRPEAEGAFKTKVAEHAEIDAPLYFFQVRRGDEEVVFRSPNMGNVVFGINPPHEPNVTDATSALGVIRIGQYEDGPYHVQIATSLGNIRQFASYYLQVSLLVSGIALTLSIFFGHRLSRVALDPIRRIQRIAERISADNLGTRIPGATGNDEIASLVRLLNQMFDRLETSFDRLGRFASDASHELKTPLSLIRLQSEKLLLHGNLAASQQEVIQQQLEGINRLNSVIERLLFLAKSKVGAIRPNAKQQDTAEFIRSFDEDARVLCEDRLVSFHVVENESLSASFDATLLRHVLLNLVANALQVTPKGARITLVSRRENNTWTVRVEDEGSGVPETQLEEIFEPFMRLHPSNGQEDHELAGTGLGLAICRSVLEVHDGSIRAENRQPGPGLCVAFSLPLASRSESEGTVHLAPARSMQTMEIEAR